MLLIQTMNVCTGTKNSIITVAVMLEYKNNQFKNHITWCSAKYTKKLLKYPENCEIYEWDFYS